MINNKIWGLVGLAARARKICFGADSVEQEMKKKKVKLVLIAQDSSENKIPKIMQRKPNRMFNNRGHRNIK